MENTRKKILKAAAELFVRYGFDGTSISQIAKMAKVNQSLIYHYFFSKEELWKSVKAYYVEKIEPEILPKAEIGLKAILQHIVESRFCFYKKNPKILRMMNWQRLERSRSYLTGGTSFSPDVWKPIFLKLQENGEIRSDVNIDFMILFIISLIAGALTEDQSNFLQSESESKKYLAMIVNSVIQTFAKN